MVSNDQNVLEGLLPKIAIIRPLCKISKDPCQSIADVLCSRVKAAVAAKLKSKSFCALGAAVEERLRKDPKRQLLLQSIEAHSNFLKQEVAVTATCHDLESKLGSLNDTEKAYLELNHKVVSSNMDTTDLADAVKMLVTECGKKLKSSSDLVGTLLGNLLSDSWHQKVADNADFKSLSECAGETIGKIKAKPLSASLDGLEKEIYMCVCVW